MVARSTRARWSSVILPVILTSIFVVAALLWFRNDKDTPTATAFDDSAAAANGEIVRIDVLANDRGSAPLFVEAITSSPAHGVAALIDEEGFAQAVTYTPDLKFCGVDTFDYRLAGEGAAAATVSVEVLCNVHTPVAADDSAVFEHDEGVVVDVVDNDEDRDGSPLTLETVDDPEHGLAEIADNRITYRPVPGYFGNDTFSYTVSNANGLQASATVIVDRRCTVSVILVPSCGALWGSAQIPGDVSDLVALEERIGWPLPIAHVFHDGSELFPTNDENALTRRPEGSTLLFANVKLTGASAVPVTWKQIADGAIDDHLRQLANSFASHGQSLFVTLHHEPEDDVQPESSSGFTTVDYAAMYRHVVDTIDAELDAQDVPQSARPVWVWDMTGYPRWEPLWLQLYPGDEYVDWVAYDPYLQEPINCDFGCIANRTWSEYPEWTGFYNWATTQFPDKPLMLGEWGVQESKLDGGESAKANLFESVPVVMANQFPQLKALVYFSDNKSPQDPTASRIDTTEQSLAAFRTMVSNPYFNAAP